MKMVEMAAMAMGGGSQWPAVVCIVATASGDGNGDDSGDDSSGGGVEDGRGDNCDGCGGSSGDDLRRSDARKASDTSLNAGIEPLRGMAERPGGSAPPTIGRNSVH